MIETAASAAVGTVNAHKCCCSAYAAVYIDAGAAAVLLGGASTAYSAYVGTARPLWTSENWTVLLHSLSATCTTDMEDTVGQDNLLLRAVKAVDLRLNRAVDGPAI